MDYNIRTSSWLTFYSLHGMFYDFMMILSQACWRCSALVDRGAVSEISHLSFLKVGFIERIVLVFSSSTSVFPALLYCVRISLKTLMGGAAFEERLYRYSLFIRPCLGIIEESFPILSLNKPHLSGLLLLICMLGTDLVCYR